MVFFSLLPYTTIFDAIYVRRTHRQIRVTVVSRGGGEGVPRYENRPKTML